MGGCSSIGAVFQPSTVGTKPANSNQACDKSSGAMISVLNQITSVSIVQTNNSCFADLNVEQNISMTCEPKFPLGSNIDVFEANAACTSCLDGVQSSLDSQHVLERAMWNNSPAQVRLPIGQEYQILIDRTTGCKDSCKACNFTNITQANISRINQDCAINLTNKALFQSNLNVLLNETFLNNQDVLAATAKTVGISNLANLSSYISSTISNQDFTSILTEVNTRLNTQQIIELSSSNSISVSNVTQTSLYNIVQTVMSNSSLIENAFSSATINNIAAIVNQQQTLDSIGQVLFNSTVTFVSAIDSAVGSVMLAMMILLGVIVLAVIGYGIYRGVKSKESNLFDINEREKKQIRERANKK